MFGTRSAIENAVQNQQRSTQQPVTEAQPNANNTSTASSVSSIPVVTAQPPAENPVAPVNYLPLEVQRTMARLIQSQESHQEDRHHDSTKGRNIYRSLEEEIIIYETQTGKTLYAQYVWMTLQQEKLV